MKAKEITFAKKQDYKKIKSNKNQASADEFKQIRQNDALCFNLPNAV